MQATRRLLGNKILNKVLCLILQAPNLNNNNTIDVVLLLLYIIYIYINIYVYIL